MSKTILTLILSLASYFVAVGQIENRIWLRTDSNSCLEFDTLSNRMNIGNFFANYLEGEQRFEYAIEDSNLTIDWYFNERMFGYERERTKCVFNILENGLLSLQITSDRDKSGGISELLGGYDGKFRSVELKNCNEYYKHTSR